jgi:hypothetical protein
VAVHDAPQVDAPMSAPVVAPEPSAPVVIPAGHKLARDVFGDLPKKVLDVILATLTIPVFAHPEAEGVDFDYRYQASTLVPALIAMHTSPSMRVWCGGPAVPVKPSFVRAWLPAPAACCIA